MIVFCYHGNKSTILLFYSIFRTTAEVSSTLLKYVKSQRSYSFLITKELIFGFQILDLKDHFSASLKNVLHTAGGLLWMAYCIRLGLDSAICLDDSFTTTTATTTTTTTTTNY